tara:strand:- start:5568 stop:6287 length:720 start_codon:yes stop_codon:yes gene_type:complete
MKKEELKRDPVAEKLLSVVEYSKNNSTKIIALIFVIALFVSGIGYYQNSQNQLVFESKLAVDEIMLQLVNQGLNNPDYFNDKLNTQIDSLYSKYPKSKYTNYLAFIVHSETTDSLKSQMIGKINDAKNRIENNWFKSQAYFVAGDFYVDNGEFDEAIKNYTNAIYISESRAQKAYGNYKLACAYFEKKDYDQAYKFYREADVLFNISKENVSLDRNQQFSSWFERNSIAMSKVKNILKK